MPKLETKVVRIPKDLYKKVSDLRDTIIHIDDEELTAELRDLKQKTKSISTNDLAGWLLAKGFLEFKKEWGL